MLINFIGCGKIGKTLAKLIQQNKVATIQDIVTTHPLSAQSAQIFIGAGTVCLEISNLRPADIYFIATPDQAIEPTLQNLLSQHILATGSIIAHFSGALSSEILAAARRHNCLVASIHPIKSFADPGDSVRSFSGTYCTLEGDVNALEKLASLFTKLGGKVFSIDPSKKALYHAATAFASNYLVALDFIATTLLTQATISKELAKEIVASLMQGALNNLKTLSPQMALTGPLQRGDITTLRQHLDSLENSSFLAAYRELAKITLSFTTHKDEVKQSIEKLLTQQPLSP